MSIIYPQFHPSDSIKDEDMDSTKLINLIRLSINEIESKRLNIFDSEFFDYSSIGTPVAEQKIHEIYDMMLAVAVKYGYPNSDKRIQSDKPWAEILHQHMGITRNEASKEGIWNALSCHYMPNLVAWRWPNGYEEEIPEEEASETDKIKKTHLAAKSVKISNRWLTQDNRRHAFSRLWWRAELLLDDADKSDPYHILGKLKEYQIADITERPGLASFNKVCIIIAKLQIAKNALGEDKSIERIKFRDGLKLLGLRLSIRDIDALDGLKKIDEFVDECLNNLPNTV